MRERVNFAVEPGAAATIAEVPRELVPGLDAVLIADAATSLAAHPETRAWHVSAHDLSLEGPIGRAWQPKATIECDALVRIHAITPLIDAVIVPVGDWRRIDPMLLTLAAGESATARIEWNAPPNGGHNVELHCGGRRIATA